MFALYPDACWQPISEEIKWTLKNFIKYALKSLNFFHENNVPLVFMLNLHKIQLKSNISIVEKWIQYNDIKTEEKICKIYPCISVTFVLTNTNNT